jgi:hypothetical protein
MLEALMLTVYPNGSSQETDGVSNIIPWLVVRMIMRRDRVAHET